MTRELGASFLSCVKYTWYARICSGPSIAGDRPKWRANRATVSTYARWVCGDRAGSRTPKGAGTLPECSSRQLQETSMGRGRSYGRVLSKPFRLQRGGASCFLPENPRLQVLPVRVVLACKLPPSLVGV